MTKLRAARACMGGGSRMNWTGIPASVLLLGRRTSVRLAAALALGAIASGAQAQKMPENIRIIVPFAAGGGIDVLARVLAQELSPKLARPIIVENRVGA